MSLNNIDHVALAVPNLDEFIHRFISTQGLRLIRRGFSTATGQHIAMLGDRKGVKLELIESPDCVSVQFLHLAFATNDLEGSVDHAREAGWTLTRGPNPIDAARAKSAFLQDGHIEFQLLQYQPDSPDLATW